jgi:hypothetical protein
LPQTCHFWRASRQNPIAKQLQVWYYYYSGVNRRSEGLPGGNERFLPAVELARTTSQRSGVATAFPQARSDRQEHASHLLGLTKLALTFRSDSVSVNEKLSIAELASLFGIDPQVLQTAVDRQRIPTGKPFLTIPEAAVRWSCSRGSVYNFLREAGVSIVDFAPPGKKGKKLIPLEVVERIERQHTKKIK